MLTISIPKQELFLDDIQEFISIGPWELNFEHSLISISKWEMKFKKPFLKKEERSQEESLYYIRCMLLNDYKEDVCSFLSIDNIKEINNYVIDLQTATTFGKEEKNISREIVTSELVYYWMVALEIPFECEKWNFNRLMTLIRICNIKNAPPKKRPKKDIVEKNHNLNEERKRMLGTSG